MASKLSYDQVGSLYTKVFSLSQEHYGPSLSAALVSQLKDVVALRQTIEADAAPLRSSRKLQSKADELNGQIQKKHKQLRDCEKTLATVSAELGTVAFQAHRKGELPTLPLFKARIAAEDALLAVKAERDSHKAAANASFWTRAKAALTSLGPSMRVAAAEKQCAAEDAAIGSRAVEEGLLDNLVCDTTRAVAQKVRDSHKKYEGIRQDVERLNGEQECLYEQIRKLLEIAKSDKRATSALIGAAEKSHKDKTKSFLENASDVTCALLPALRKCSTLTSGEPVGLAVEKLLAHITAAHSGPDDKGVTAFATEWCVGLGEESVSSISLAQIRSLVEAHKLDKAVLVKRIADSSWQLGAAVPEVAAVLANAERFPLQGGPLGSLLGEKRVTVDVTFLPVTGYSDDDLRLVVDGTVVGWTPLSLGIEGLEFETNVGDHVVTLETVRPSGAKSVQDSKQFTLSFSMSGHYRVRGTKAGVLSAFPSALEIYGYAAGCKDTISVPQSRKHQLIGLWEGINKTERTWTFSGDSTLLRAPGGMSKYEWCDRDTVQVTTSKGKTELYTVATLSAVELVLVRDEEVLSFEKGLTATEAKEAEDEERRKRERAEARAKAAATAASLAQTAAGIAAVAGAGAVLGSMLSGGGDAGAAGSSGSQFKGEWCKRCGGTGKMGGVAKAPDCPFCFGKGFTGYYT